MTELKLNVKALAAMKNMSIEELAKAAGINPNHLREVSRGRTQMSAADLAKLAEATDVPMNMIQY